MMSHPSSLLRNNTTGILHHAVWLSAISILYWVVFLVPLPPQLKRQGIFLTDEFIIVVLLALVFLTYRQQVGGSKYLRLGLILIAFTLPLLRLWETAESTWNIVLGLLPWADATEYYFDANRLIEGGLFSAFSGRRPMYGGLLAVLLELSNQNLQVTLIIFTIINALVVFLFVEDIRSEFGAVSAIIALFLSQLFYRPFVGTMLTEQFGYSIGLLALIVLLRAVKITNLGLFSLGMMLLTYALLIRAGTFFVLPVLIIFAVFYLAKNRREYIKVLLAMVIAVGIPVLSNTWLGRAVSSPGAVEFANFADTLYGQTKGGLRWTQAVIDHPELASMIEPERSRYLYRLAFEEIIRNPSGLVKGSIKAWTDFILPGPLSAFGFLTFGNKLIDFLFQVLAALVFLIGLWQLWRRRKNTVIAFVLAYWLGTLFSIPFLPPIDAGIRPYAATIASIFLPVCFVFSQAVFKRLENAQHENGKIPVKISYSLASTLIILSLAGAPLLKTIAKPSVIYPIACEAEQIPIHFRLNHGSYISLSSAEEGRKTRVPAVLLEDVHRSFDDFPYGDFASILRQVKKPVLVAAVTDISTGRGMWVVAPEEWKVNEGQTTSACAETVFAVYSVMFLKTAEKP
jgi:hypothetical protein